MEAFSPLCTGLMLAGCVLFFLPGVAHHVFCGAVEWFYLRLGRTEEAREVIVDFFKGTSATMFLCYLGLLLFAVSLFVPVVSGATELPRWAVSVQHPAPVPIAVPSSHCRDDESSQRSAVFRAICFDLR